uniref:Low-density lipoprotein receptor class A domain-containing protein 2 isoform X2 n=1 Tax=Geotrypetes seraphini TaxID=260995 RepID=A0A6P8NNH7_GEOSA|nr:low-density lipoprotein receptor class A domain-containing protein 2 isoform X2 [Geotrypetes seraphini]
MVKAKRMHLELMVTLFILLSCLTLTVHSIDTVNLVDFCGQTIESKGMIVNSHKESRKYYFVTIGTDCQLTMQASSLKDKIQFQFRFFLVYSLLRMSTTTTVEPPGNIKSDARVKVAHGREWDAEDPCNAGSYVQFYDGKGRNALPLGSPLCGKSIPRPILSTGNYLTLRLVTRGQQPRVDFVGDFTSFRLEPLSTEIPEKTLTTAAANSTTQGVRFLNMSCGSADRIFPRSPDAILQHGSLTDKRTYVSFLVLYIILGLSVGVALLFWCCWSPGWFIWRVSACRFCPCCNSFCASCNLCTRSCYCKGKNRPGKVTPQNPPSTPM